MQPFLIRKQLPAISCCVDLSNKTNIDKDAPTHIPSDQPRRFECCNKLRIISFENSTDLLPSQSRSTVLNKLNVTQQTKVNDELVKNGKKRNLKNTARVHEGSPVNSMSAWWSGPIARFLVTQVTSNMPNISRFLNWLYDRRRSLLIFCSQRLDWSCMNCTSKKDIGL